MAGTISGLKIQKKNKERVNVFLDGDYAFPVTLTVAATLKRGQFLSDSEIETLKEQDDRNKAYNHAVYFLGFRVRSQVEMESYLRDKGYSYETRVETIEKLLQYGYLDDAEFARAFVADRQRFRPRSRRALGYELRQKGLSEADIEAALTDVDEDALAYRALTSKIRQWQHLAEPDFRKKAFAFLNRRGFNYEITSQAVERVWNEIEAELCSQTEFGNEGNSAL